MWSIINTFSPVVYRSQLHNYHPDSMKLFNSTSIRTFRLAFPTFRVRASSTAVIETTTEPVTTDEKKHTNGSILGCPICYEPLTWSGDSSLSIETVQGTTLECNTCKKTYYETGSSFNLTASSGSKDYRESMPLVTEFFSTPFMSILYERGWRQNFGLGGYPGPDREDVESSSKSLNDGGDFDHLVGYALACTFEDEVANTRRHERLRFGSIHEVIDEHGGLRWLGEGKGSRLEGLKVGSSCQESSSKSSYTARPIQRV